MCRGRVTSNGRVHMNKKVYKDRNGNEVVPRKVAPGEAAGAVTWGDDVRLRGLEEDWKEADTYPQARWCGKTGKVVVNGPAWRRRVRGL